MELSSLCYSLCTIIIAFVLFTQIVSEEHDDSKSKVDVDIPTPSKSRAEVAQLKDEQVLSSDVTIWVDPLDATQEYTGKILTCYCQ